MGIDSTDKDMRLRAMKELITTEQIEDQAALVERLASVYGIKATQAVISRDLKSLGAVKKSLGGSSVYSLPEEDLQRSLLKRVVQSVRHNESLICIATLPGMADFVAEWIDRSELDVLGSIAGENTVFVAPQRVSDTEKLAHELRGIMCTGG